MLLALPPADLLLLVIQQLPHSVMTRQDDIEVFSAAVNPAFLA